MEEAATQMDGWVAVFQCIGFPPELGGLQVAVAGVDGDAAFVGQFWDSLTQVARMLTPESGVRTLFLDVRIDEELYPDVSQRHAFIDALRGSGVEKCELRVPSVGPIVDSMSGWHAEWRADRAGMLEVFTRGPVGMHANPRPEGADQALGNN